MRQSTFSSDTADDLYGPSGTPEFSLVIPMHNEEESARELYQKLVEVMEARYPSFEILFVDDDSTDRTYRLLAEIAARDPRVILIKLKRNFGQTPALAAGFDYARGEIIVSMDGDLQHDPSDIPNLIEKIFEGYDLASGWRKERVDNLVLRRIPSRVANWMMAKLSGVELHDFGTTFKAYRRNTIKRIKLYGELHRFIPALASWNGAKICEVPIKNTVRENGASHYGISRTFRVMFDLLTVRFLLKYVTRPLHFFGGWGLLATMSGLLIAFFLIVKKLWSGGDVFLEHGPLMMMGMLLVLTGVQLVSTGLVAELLARTYFESQGRTIYTVETIVNHIQRTESRDATTVVS
ncbi:MAG: glycosyltransferase family 2 protein [Acidobacteria bacterium]|nr:glycosyltransferase family 2 protein [Acidobacteriota bacterium]